MKILQYSSDVKKSQYGRRRDPLGAVSFGVFLIILAVMQLSNPDLAGQVIDYLRSFSTYGHPVSPPPNILVHIAEFCLYFGVWLILLGALRVSFRLGVWSIPGDITGGIFLIILNYLILDTIKSGGDPANLLPLLIVGIGIAVIAGAIGQIMLRR